MPRCRGIPGFAHNRAESGIGVGLKKREAKLCFVGTSHAAQHLSAAAYEKGFDLVPADKADVVFISEDTPIAKDGTRDQQPIVELFRQHDPVAKCLVVTSQVEPGFMQAMRPKYARRYVQVELMRMRDAGERARHPEMMVVGCKDPRPYRGWPPPADGAYQEYLDAWDCPLLFMQYTQAEFTKIAVNMALAAQVDYANRMKAACDKLDIGWDVIAEAVHLDSRIGPHAYLEPGRWADSLHLLRDARTLERILKSE